MAGYSNKSIKVLAQPSGTATDVVVTEGISVSQPGSLYMRLSIKAAVSAGSIDFKLQQKVTTEWVDVASANSQATLAANGQVSLTLNNQVAADQPDLPLSNSIRLIADVTGFTGTIEQIDHIQGT